VRAPALRSRRAAVKNGASCATPLADLSPVRNSCPCRTATTKTLPKGLRPLAPARGLPSLPHCAALRLCRPRGFPLSLRSVASPGRFPSPCSCYPRRRGPGPRRSCVNNNSTAISNPEGHNQMTLDITATYSPEDNKLRLYASSRLDTATYEGVKAAGFKWAPKQDLFVAPM